MKIRIALAAATLSAAALAGAVATAEPAAAADGCCGRVISRMGALHLLHGIYGLEGLAEEEHRTAEFVSTFC